MRHQMKCLHRQLWFAGVFLGGCLLAGVHAQAKAPSAQILRYFYYDYDEETYETYGDGQVEVICLSQSAREEYPLLYETLSDASEEAAAAYETQFQQMVSDSRNDAMNGHSYEAYLKTEIELVRTDERVLSFRESYADYQGGAHGYYCYNGFNYDAATGSEILLSDLCSDEEGLRRVLQEKLMERYPGGSVGTLGTTLDDYSIYAQPREREGSGYPYPYNWVLGQDGITFWFNPYEIASYAEGILTVEVGFDECPGLRADAYQIPQGTWTRTVPINEALLGDLDGDGVQDYLQVVMDSNLIYESWAETSLITIENQDGECAYDAGPFFNPKAYLMPTAGGKMFLYVDVNRENDYHTLEIFDVNGVPFHVASIVGGFAYTYQWETGAGVYQPPTDSACFVLGERMNVLSTYTGTRSYQVGEDGLPEALEESYRAEPLQTPLKTVKVLPVWPLDPATGAIGEEGTFLTPGTEVQIWGTDGSTYVDLVREDGIYGRVYVTMEGWQTYINGEEAGNYFEQLYYAG